jgi:hypothetical protein
VWNCATRDELKKECVALTRMRELLKGDNALSEASGQGEVILHGVIIVDYTRISIHRSSKH